MRRLASTAAAVLALGVLAATAHAQQPSILGNWQGQLNWNMPAGMFLQLALDPNGHIVERFTNHQGVSLVISGTYRFDPANGLLVMQFTDWGPRQLCSAVVGCTPVAPPPPGLLRGGQLRVAFPAPNMMVVTDPDGAQMAWFRP